MESRPIQETAVIGAGLLGHGIALEYAVAGYQVRISDRSASALDRAMDRVHHSLNMLVSLGRVNETQVNSVLGRISPVTKIEDAAISADLIIEAVFENLELKRQIFERLDESAPKHAILLSNTSTFVPSALIENDLRAQQVAVAHYFNPPHLLPVVEVVRGPFTSNQTIERVVTFLRSVGKRPAIVNREVPGFIGNRLQAALFREALALVQAGVATPEDIDTVVKYGFGRRLAAAGPFEVWEQASWDLISSILERLYPEIDASQQVPSILTDLVKQGHLGTKTGKGFYDWTPAASDALHRHMGKMLALLAQQDR